MIGLGKLFSRGKKKVYFAVVLADRPTEGFVFQNDKDCKMFVATGEVTPGMVIPPTVLKEMAERFDKPADEKPDEGRTVISEEVT